MKAGIPDEWVEAMYDALHQRLNGGPYMMPPDVLDEAARAALAAVIPLVQEAEREACRREAVAIAHQFEQSDPRHETGWVIAEILRARNPA